MLLLKNLILACKYQSDIGFNILEFGQKFRLYSKEELKEFYIHVMEVLDFKLEIKTKNFLKFFFELREFIQEEETKQLDL